MLRLTYERVARRLTQTRLADLAGITPAHLCNVEQGLRQPSADVLAALARALDVSPPEVLLLPVTIQEATTTEAGR